MSGAYNRKGGPRVEKYTKGGSYQVLGLAEVSPIFPNRLEAEKWLRGQLAKTGQTNRPRLRNCLRCQREFMSAHVGNRLCACCRSQGDLGSLAIAAASSGRVRRVART